MNMCMHGWTVDRMIDRPLVSLLLFLLHEQMHACINGCIDVWRNAEVTYSKNELMDALVMGRLNA